MSLKLRLALFNTIFVLIALGIGLFLLVSQTRRVFSESLDRDLISRARMVARNPNMRGPGGFGFGQGGPGGPNQGGQKQNGPGNPPNDQPRPQAVIPATYTSLAFGQAPAFALLFLW